MELDTLIGPQGPVSYPDQSKKPLLEPDQSVTRRNNIKGRPMQAKKFVRIVNTAALPLGVGF